MVEPSLSQGLGSKRRRSDALAEALPPDRHCQQGLQSGYEIAENIIFQRVLCHETAAERTYVARKGEAKTVCHWGQRKLIMAEIEFLTQFSGLARTVVYAGAAPGVHVPYLAELFPKLFFILVDPRPFDKNVTSCHAAKEECRITHRQEYFTNAMATEYSAIDGVLFISDVRTSDDQSGKEPTNEEVKADMELQQVWHQLMQPVASCLKFRLPWSAGSTSYLDGEIHLPVWGPQSTTECRLFVKRCMGTKLYDNTKYESQMFYFNTHQRIAKYSHSCSDFYRCRCYDCTAEVDILKKYMSCAKNSHGQVLEGGVAEDANDDDKVVDVSLRLNKECHRDHRHARTLFDPNPEPGERKGRMRKKQHLASASNVVTTAP